MRCLFVSRTVLVVSISLFLLAPLEPAAQQFDPRERFETPAVVRISQPVLRSLMKNEVLPDYPREAKKKGIQGTVFVFLSLDEKGGVSNVAVFGNPFLASVTMEAVNKSRFRPYYQNNEPVSSEGQIAYRFKLLPNGHTSVSFAPEKTETIPHE